MDAQSSKESPEIFVKPSLSKAHTQALLVADQIAYVDCGAKGVATWELYVYSPHDLCKKTQPVKRPIADYRTDGPTISR